MRKLNDNRRTSLSKSLRGHILHESIRLLAFRLDVLNGRIVPFLFNVLIIRSGSADRNGRGQNDDTLDVATRRFGGAWCKDWWL